MSNHLIKIDNVTKTYTTQRGVHQALKGVSLEINKGEIYSLLGVNGAGKTTLSSILATLHPPTSGHVYFKGKSIYDDLMGYRRALGFCPQRPNLDVELNVRDNLLFAGRYFLLTNDQAAERTEILIKSFQLEDVADKEISELSGGYRQRVLLARSLIHNPELVILDEPTVGLDPHIRRQLWDQIAALKEQDVSVILTTHYLDEAEVLADRVCILDKGLVKLIDTPKNLKSLHNKASLEAVFLQLMREQEELPQ